MLTTPAPHCPRVAPGSDDSLDRALLWGRRMLDAVQSLALQLDLPDLGDINLPPVIGSAADQSHLQTVGPLYLASELEAAQLLPAVEMLAGIFVSGGLQSDIGDAGREIEAFWQSRNQRFVASERQAFFSRLFGGSAGPTIAGTGAPNTEFEPLMVNLTEALYKLEPVAGYGPQPDTEVVLQTAAEQLASNLIPRSGGIAAYAGKELLGAIQDALRILKNPVLQEALRAHSVWEAVRNIVADYLHQETDIASHVARGRAGLLVLAWLAQSLPSMNGVPGAVPSPDASVVGAATTWLQSSLALEERHSAVTPGR